MNKFAHLRQAGLPGQFCLTWCQSDDLQEVARAFGADLLTGLWAEPDEIEDIEEEHPGELLQLAAADGWVIALEPNGFQGVRDEILAPLSRGGPALSLFWNSEQDSAVKYAAGGDVLTTFDLADIDRRTGGRPEALDDLLQQAGLHNALPTQARMDRALVLGEKLSGRHLTTDWLHSPQLVFTITDPLPDQIVPAACLHPRMPFLDEPEFAALLEAPTPAVAPIIVRMVATTALRVASLDESWEREILGLLDHGEQHNGQRESLRQRLTAHAADVRLRAARLRHSPGQTPEAERLDVAAHATSILAEALHPLPLTAAEATAQAAYLRLPRRDHLRMQVLHNVMRRIAYDLRNS
ncbi:DUF6461 domain-containing protein [Nonomuraea jabiensis]|uniref:DUF6461 domain-containing protein n=1 Tax=Nonomuraea jabiensis TaxID=882448 RepID=UPI0034291C3A